MKKAIIVLMCILAALLVACRNDVVVTDPPEDNLTTPSIEVTPTPTESTTPTPLPGAELPQEKTIYFIAYVIGSGISLGSIFYAGATDAGEDLGVNVITAGVPGGMGDRSSDDQIILLQNAVRDRADAIVLRPTDYVALADEVSKTYLAGIPIIIIDVPVDTEDYTAFIGTDNYAAGETAAKELIRLLKEEKNIPETQSGTIAVQVGSEISQTIIDRNAGFKAYWDAYAPEAWVVLWDKMQVNEGSIEKAIIIAKNVLASEPELIAMFAPNNGSTVGCVMALTAMDRTDIAMLGFDFSREIELMIREGNFTVSTILLHQYSLGYEGIRLALEAANGALVSEKNIDAGVLVVTVDNIDSPEVLKPAFGYR